MCSRSLYPKSVMVAVNNPLSSAALKNAVAGNAYSCRSADKSAFIQQSAMHALISFISRLVHSAISRISSSEYPIFNIFSITRCLFSLWPSTLPLTYPISLSSAAISLHALHISTTSSSFSILISVPHPEFCCFLFEIQQEPYLSDQPSQP